MPVAALIAFFATSLLSLYFGISELIKKDKNWKKLIAFLFVFCISLGFGLYDILDKENKSSKDKNDIIISSKTAVDSSTTSVNKLIDSTKKAIIDSIKKSGNEIKDQNDLNTEELFKKIPGPKEEIKAPLLDFCIGDESHINPFTKLSPKGDSLKCTFVICNFGNDHAYNLIDKIIPVNYIENKARFYQYKIKSISNESVVLPVGKSALLFEIQMYPLKNGPKVLPFTNPVYVYFKLKYKNVGNQEMNPLRKIFSLDENGLREVNQETYEKVEQDLKQNEYW